MRIDRRAASECRAMGVGAQEEFLLLPPLRLSHPPSSSPPQTHQSDSAVRPRSPVGHRRRRCLSAAAVKSCPPAGQAVPPTSHDTHARSSKLARQHARRTPPAGALVVGSVGHRRLDLDLGLGMRLFAVGITLSVQSINAHHQTCPMSRAPALPPTISLPLPFPPFPPWPAVHVRRVVSDTLASLSPLLASCTRTTSSRAERACRLSSSASGLPATRSTCWVPTSRACFQPW